MQKFLHPENRGTGIKIIFLKFICFLIYFFGICFFHTHCDPMKPERNAVDFEKEKAAIKTLIAKETESNYDQDFET